MELAPGVGCEVEAAAGVIAAGDPSAVGEAATVGETAAGRVGVGCKVGIAIGACEHAARMAAAASRRPSLMATDMGNAPPKEAAACQAPEVGRAECARGGSDAFRATAPIQLVK
jgi:hypothetical protein